MRVRVNVKAALELGTSLRRDPWAARPMVSVTVPFRVRVRFSVWYEGWLVGMRVRVGLRVSVSVVPHGPLGGTPDAQRHRPLA